MAMILWIIWGISMVVSIFVGIETWKCESKFSQKQLMIMVTFCTIITGGIIAGKFMGALLGGSINSERITILNFTVWDYLLVVVVTLIAMYLIFLVGSIIICFDIFDKRQKIFLVVIFTISVIGWTIPIANYNRNVQISERTVVVNTTDQELVYFWNIPVQNVSGKIKGSSFIGIGSVNGSITTSDIIPYWYIGDDGDSYYDTSDAQYSKIKFIGDDETPYVEITYYQNQRVTENNNNGKEKIEVELEWAKYTFYLPESMKQFNLG